jgi:drug/metabolite transporter (DMT)-like permease
VKDKPSSEVDAKQDSSNQVNNKHHPSKTMANLNITPHQLAVAQALFVAFLWSTSWVLIKIGLVDIPPLTFAGLRYTLGFIFLLLWFLRSGGLQKLGVLKWKDWITLLMLGVLLYSLTQGALFFGLAHLPAATVNLIISFSSIVVALAGIIYLREVPSLLQWVGICLSIVGAVVYFMPLYLPVAQVFGIIAVFAGMLTNSTAQVMGRQINFSGRFSPSLVTVVSMGIGGLLLLGAGAAIQGVPTITMGGWLIIAWLALVNTAFAFTVYNLTLRTLSAIESSLIINTMIFQIPILAWIFLGEQLSLKEVIGLSCVALGIALVQIRSKETPGEQ